MHVWQLFLINTELAAHLQLHETQGQHSLGYCVPPGFMSAARGASGRGRSWIPQLQEKHCLSLHCIIHHSARQHAPLAPCLWNYLFPLWGTQFSWFDLTLYLFCKKYMVLITLKWTTNKGAGATGMLLFTKFYCFHANRFQSKNAVKSSEKRTHKKRRWN